MPEVREQTPTRRTIRLLVLFITFALATWCIFTYLQSIRPDAAESSAAEASASAAQADSATETSESAAQADSAAASNDAEQVDVAVEESSSTDELESKTGEGRGLMSMLFGQQTGGS